MRKLTYLVATSADGYIAAEDGSIDGFVADPEYLDRLFAAYPETCPGHLREPLRVSGENRCFDTALMGRATYEAGLEVGVTNPFPTHRQYVFSTTMASSPDPNVTLVASDPGAFVEELKRDEGMGIWLCGGGRLAGALQRAGLVDELLIKLNPIVLGAGIPLFSGRAPPAKLRLEEERTLPAGVALLRYRMCA